MSEYRNRKRRKKENVLMEEFSTNPYVSFIKLRINFGGRLGDGQGRQESGGSPRKIV